MLNRFKMAVEDAQERIADNFFALVMYEELEKRQKEFQPLDTQSKPVGSGTFTLDDKRDGGHTFTGVLTVKKLEIKVSFRCKYHNGSCHVYYLCDHWERQKACWEIAASTEGWLGTDFLAECTFRNLGWQAGYLWGKKR